MSLFKKIMMLSIYDEAILCSNGCWFGDTYPKGTKHCYECGCKTTLGTNLKCTCGKEMNARGWRPKFCGTCGKPSSKRWDELKKKYNK